MRVVHIIKVTRISGAERHLLLLLSGLIQRGVDARLVILVERDKPMDYMLAEARNRAIPITRLTIRRDYDLALLWHCAPCCETRNLILCIPIWCTPTSSAMSRPGPPASAA